MSHIFRFNMINSKYIYLVDTSYIVYYSSFATWRAYSYRANIPKELLGPQYDPTLDEAFTNRFQNKFKQCILQSAAKVFPMVDRSNFIFCLDCPRKEIWRGDFYPDYKASRNTLAATYDFNIGKVFQYAYNYILPKIIEDYNAIKIQCKYAEGDDIIAILAKKYNSNGKKVVIISGDRDMVQLHNENTTIITIDGIKREPQQEIETIIKKPVNNEITAKEFLLFKILIGDPSDQIPNIKNGLGPKRAFDLVINKDKLVKLLQEDKLAAAAFARNKKLISMEEIPREVSDLVLEITKQQLELREEENGTIV